MITMQYNIVLPSDYDMEIIKNRTLANGHKTDGFTDLALKAYLVAEKEKYGNYENQYAPFYWWDQAEGMNCFLLDGYFDNIITSFGRPQVNNWIVLHADIENAKKGKFAIVEKMQIPNDTNFEDFSLNEEENFNSWMNDSETKSYITSYNPQAWELCRFHLSTDLEMLRKLSKGTLVYDVYHISR